MPASGCRLHVTRAARGFAACAFLFLLAMPGPADPAVPRGRLYLQQHRPQGGDTIQALPPGQGLVQLVADGRVLRSRAVDPDAPLRLIVQFDAEPVATARLRRLDATLALQRPDQLRSDLARLSTSRATRTRAAPLVEVTHVYSQVFSGAAIAIAPELYESVRALPYVRGVFPDDTVRATLEESVPLIGADRVANELHGTGAGIRVGVVDTGIDYDHPAFGGGFGPGHRVAGGYDFANDDPDPIDDYGHGTHVAGIMAGNGGGVVGVATGATLYAFKVLDAKGYGYASWILAGLERVLDPDQDPATPDGMQVINLSLGSQQGGADDPMSVALDHLTEAGVVCVAAAGNYPLDFLMGAPATSRLAITVGASTKLDRMADFSTPGPVAGSLDLKPDVVAPGVDIVSAARGGGRVALSGTSMAAPHVAGVVAQLRQLHPGWTPDQLKAAVSGTAKDLSYAPFLQGAGRVNAYAAATAGFLITPAHLAFGRDDDSQHLWIQRDTLHVVNVSAASRIVTMPVSVALTTGAVLRLTPNSVSIPAGQTADVVATLTVDNAVTPFPNVSPFAYTTTLTATSGSQTCRVPISFHKAASLRVHTQGPLSWLVVHDRRASGYARAAFSDDEVLLLPPGSYDVVASFYPPLSFVVREGVAVSGDTDLEVASSEAELHLEFSNVGPDGAPVHCNDGSVSLYYPQGRIGINYVGYGFQEIRTNPLSSDYHLEWTRSAVDPVSRTTFSGAMSGVAASQVISNRPKDLRHVVLDFPRVPADSSGLLVFHFFPLRFSPGYFGVASFDLATPPIVGPFAYDEWIQLAPYPDHLLALQQVMLFRRTAVDLLINQPQLLGSYLRLDRGWPLEGAAIGLLDTTAFRFGGEHMNLFGGIPVWQGWFANNSTAMNLTDAGGTYTAHLVSDMYSNLMLEPDLPYTLMRDGVPLESDVLHGVGGFASIGWISLPLAPGAYDLHTPRPYVLRGRPGTMEVDAHFDTRLADTDPPWLRTLQLFADGEAADSIAFTRALDAGLRFRMMDRDALCPASVWVRDGSGDRWTPLAVERQGGEFVARFPPWLSGEIALRLLARDDAGNSLSLGWDPAFIAVPGSIPAIASLAVDAAGGAVRVAWRVGAGAGQRLNVERRDGVTSWRTLGIATVDASGVAEYRDVTVLPGHAYAYRVSVVLGGTPQASGEVWITVPAGLEFALTGVRPNPSSNADLFVDFSLPLAGPATLELYDLSGRRVQAEDVGGLGVGRHLHRFAPGAPPPPGLYFLRLAQGGRSLTSRVTVLR